MNNNLNNLTLIHDQSHNQSNSNHTVNQKQNQNSHSHSHTSHHHKKTITCNAIKKTLPSPSCLECLFTKESTWLQLQEEAKQFINKEPILTNYITNSILKHNTFEDAVIHMLATKLASIDIDYETYLEILQLVISKSDELNYSIQELIISDLIAIKMRDPACDSLLTGFLYFKGFKAIQTYRAAHVLWSINKKELALLLQSKCSELYGVDIHPAAKIGSGLLIDHATGVVIGETAVIGTNCSILHGVTLGGTGNDSHDRHPKLGNNVSIGCNSSILGNIKIGNGARIGANSVVLKPVPDNATAVGSPARIIESDNHLKKHSQSSSNSSDQRESVDLTMNNRGEDKNQNHSNATYSLITLLSSVTWKWSQVQ